MATKKRIFDALAESRRWRRASSRRLDKMTFAEQQEHLRQVTEKLFAEKPSAKALALLRR
jgi:hypothetical protein